MKRTTRILHGLLLSIVMVLGCFVPVKAEDDFDAFLTEENRKIYSSDYTEFHFGVIDYKKFGFTKPAVRLPDASYEAFAAEAARFQASLDRLHQFDFNALNEKQQHDYLAYEWYLQCNLAIDKYPDFYECFSPYNGLYSDVITNMTEFTLYDKESAEDYLTLTADFPRLLKDMLEFTRQQAAKGCFMTDAALDKQLTTMQDFVDKKEENPLIIIYSQRIDELPGLSEEEKTSYKERNRDLVLNTVYPAILSTKDELATLRGSRSVTGSVYEYENGREYYEAMANNKCSSGISLDEKRDYLAKCLTDIFDYTISHYSLGGVTIDTFNDPEEDLAYLAEHMEDFPKGPDIVYYPSYLDPSVAQPTIMAYYMPTPLDDVTSNVIRINGGIVNDDPNTLYYTLAHEGLPGHMYQFTWYYSQDINPLRHTINATGYTEGWAQYVERIMLLRSPLSTDDSEFLSCNVYLGYIMQSYADILVNGYGYDVNQLSAAMEAAGFSGMKEEDLQEIIDTVSAAPGQILPYGFGLCKMWEYNERVHASLGNDFNLEDFHLQILTNGPRPFEVVESDLQKYVEGKGQTFVKDFKLFELSATENSMGSIVSFVSKHIMLIIGALILLAVLVLWLLFKLIRWIIRKITGKNNKGD